MDSLLLFNHLKPEADALNKFSGKILMLLPNTETSKLPSVLFLDCFKCQPDFIWILPHTASDLAFISLTFFPRKFRLRRDFLRRVGKVKCLLSKQSYFFICQRRLQRVPKRSSLTSKITNKVFFRYFLLSPQIPARFCQTKGRISALAKPHGTVKGSKWINV